MDLQVVIIIVNVGVNRVFIILSLLRSHRSTYCWRTVCFNYINFRIEFTGINEQPGLSISLSMLIAGRRVWLAILSATDIGIHSSSVFECFRHAVCNSISRILNEVAVMEILIKEILTYLPQLERPGLALNGSSTGTYSGWYRPWMVRMKPRFRLVSSCYA